MAAGDRKDPRDEDDGRVTVSDGAPERSRAPRSTKSQRVARKREPTLPGVLGDIEVKVADSLTNLPAAAQTRRGKVLIRSLIVAFLVIGVWITAIVMFKVRGHRRPDFRPAAEKILAELRDGKAAKVYAEASPRFREIKLEEDFIEDMAEMRRTMGAFHEVTAVHETAVVRGPGGKTARALLRVEYDSGATNGSISFHWDDDRWKLLGLFIDMPEDVAVVESSEERREKRVDADEKVHLLARSIFDQLRDGHSDAVWDQAAPLYRSSVTKEELRVLEATRERELGAYKRVLDVTEAKQSPSQMSASFAALLEFERGIATVTLGFIREGPEWKLASYKLVLPMPREPVAATPAPAPPK